MIDGIPLVDAHIHVASRPTLKLTWQDWLGPFEGREAVTALYDESGHAIPELLDRYFEDQSADVVLVLAEYSPLVTGTQAVEDVIPLMEHNPSRFRLVANLNPHVHHPIKRELRRQLDLGATAVKIHPVHGAFAANHRSLYPAYSLCEEQGVAVVIHFGTSVFAGGANAFIDPAHISDLIRDFPELTVVLAHGGRGWHYEAAAVLAQSFPNVWIEISGLPPRRLPDYFSRFDLDRLARKFIFGTDWPGVPGIRANAQAVTSLSLSRELLEGIFYRNAVEVYGLGRLKSPERAAHSSTGSDPASPTG